MNQVLDPEQIGELVSPLPKRSSNMDAKLLSVFVQAAVEVLAAEAGGAVERGAVTLERSSYATNDVNVILTVVGNLRGVVIYCMPRETALEIISRIIGQTLSDLDELVLSGIAELGNVITGRAGMLLAGMGYNTQLSVPTLVLGKAMISVLDFHRIVVPLNLEYGCIEVHLALREALDGQGA